MTLRLIGSRRGWPLGTAKWRHGGQSSESANWTTSCLAVQAPRYARDNIRPTKNDHCAGPAQALHVMNSIITTPWVGGRVPTHRRKPREATNPPSRKLGHMRPQSLHCPESGSRSCIQCITIVCCVLGTEDTAPRPLPPWSYVLMGTHTVNELTKAGYRQREPGAAMGCVGRTMGPLCLKPERPL